MSDFENTPIFAPEDIEQNKLVAALAYFIFFIPLLAAKESAFAKFHANQGLILLISVIAVYIIGTIIPIIGWFIILPIGSLVCFVFAILGIVNALNGKAAKLPLIGGVSIIK